MPDIMMWVGTEHYPTIQHFVDEAERLGVCKRVSHPPRDAKRLFLAHDEGFKGEGVIFGYVEIEGIEIIVEDGVLPPSGCTAAAFSQVDQEEGRGCGRREDAGATYLVARATPLRLIEPGVEYEAIAPSIDKTRQRFRAWRRVDGDAILACKARVERPTRRVARAEAKKGRWSEEELASLIKAAERRDISRQEAIRRWSIENGRTFLGSLYKLDKARRGSATPAGGR